MSDTEDLVAFNDQVILIGQDWSDSRGYTAKFQFTEGEHGGHQLKEFSKGTRFQMVLVEIADDEEPIDQKLKKKLEADLKEKSKGGRWSNDCAMLCKSRDFQGYLYHKGKIAGQWDEQTRVAMAREYVLETLKIKSRREIDHSEAKVAEYHNLIIDPFHEWQRGREKK